MPVDSIPSATSLASGLARLKGAWIRLTEDVNSSKHYIAASTLSRIPRAGICIFGRTEATWLLHECTSSGATRADNVLKLVLARRFQRNHESRFYMHASDFRCGRSITRVRGVKAPCSRIVREAPVIAEKVIYI